MFFLLLKHLYGKGYTVPPKLFNCSQHLRHFRLWLESKIYLCVVFCFGQLYPLHYLGIRTVLDCVKAFLVSFSQFLNLFIYFRLSHLHQHTAHIQIIEKEEEEGKKKKKKLAITGHFLSLFFYSSY